MQRCITGSLILVAVLIGPLQAQPVAWRGDYNRARQEALEKGRPLVIDIGTENCFWCRQLDSRTFSDANLAAYLNEQTIPLKIDATRNPALPEALNIQSYPTLVFAGPDGRILHVQEGFAEAPRVRELANRAVAAIVAPEWMQRDFADARQALATSDAAKAIALLTNIVEDGKDRPLQGKARQLLAELEQQAAVRLADAKKLQAGEVADQALQQITRIYLGTNAAREASQLLALRPDANDPSRPRRAKELLDQARADYRTQQFACCLDRCELLSTQFGDLREGADGAKLASDIKANPEWMRLACDQLADRLGSLYLGMAETWLRKGQPQQAAYYLERVVQACPNSKHADAAQVRLAQLQGPPARSLDFKK